jgi:hypothetical protein
MSLANNQDPYTKKFLLDGIDVEAEIREIKTEITSIETEITSIETDITSIETDITTIETKLNDFGLENELSVISKNVPTANSEAGYSANSNHDAVILELSKNVPASEYDEFNPKLYKPLKDIDITTLTVGKKYTIICNVNIDRVIFRPTSVERSAVKYAYDAKFTYNESEYIVDYSPQSVATYEFFYGARDFRTVNHMFSYSFTKVEGQNTINLAIGINWALGRFINQPPNTEYKMQYLALADDSWLLSGESMQRHIAIFHNCTCIITKGEFIMS